MPGSLREHSFNRSLIEAAISVAPPGMTVDCFLLHDIPLYNAELDPFTTEGVDWPAPVARWRQAIADADGILFATPQYNRSYSGVLKNAIDWASRVPGNNPLSGKPAAIIGASAGKSGTAKAQEALRTLLDVVGMRVLPEPQLLVPEASQRIDEQHGLHDGETIEVIQAILDEFGVFIRDEALVGSG